MLSTLRLWAAIGLLITWVEASKDHGMLDKFYDSFTQLIV